MTLACPVCAAENQGLEREPAEPEAKSPGRRCQLHRAFADWEGRCAKCGWPELLHGRECEAVL